MSVQIKSTITNSKVITVLYTVICFVSISDNFGIGTVGGLNGTLVKQKYALGALECAYFSFNKYPI